MLLNHQGIAAVFLPNQATVLLALEVSPWLILDVLARRALNQHEGTPWKPQGNGANPKWTEGDLQRACAILGEQFIGLLAMTVRHHACREPGSPLAVIDPRGNLGLEFETALARHLQFPLSHPLYAEAMQSLTKDFREWVTSRPAELMPLGLIDKGGDGVVVTCKAPDPLLPSLPD